MRFMFWVAKGGDVTVLEMNGRRGQIISPVSTTMSQC
jgi:hypothetical protein